MPVRDLDNPAKQAVHATATCSSTTFNFCDATFLTVPAGKRLVIENVSMEARIPAGLAATMLVSGVGWLPLSQPSVDFGIGAGSFTRQNELVRGYLNPGATVSIQVQRTGAMVLSQPLTISGSTDISLTSHRRKYTETQSRHLDL